MYKTETDSQTYGCGGPEDELGEGIVREFRMDMDTRP